MDFPNSKILTCCSGSKLGLNPQTNLIHVYAGKAIYRAKTELLEMDKRDLRIKLSEDQEDNNEYTVCDIELELERGTNINSHCEIQLFRV